MLVVSLTGCKFQIFGLALGVPGKTPIFLAKMVSFSVTHEEIYKYILYS